MANSDARRMANAACCTADGGSTPLLSLFLSLALSLCLSPPPFVLSLSILCLLCCFCCCFSRCFSCCFLVLWLPTRRHVWLPLDFRHDFLSRTSLLTPLPPVPATPCCHFHIQSACCRLFFCCLLCWHFLCSLAKSQPMSCGIFK